MARSAAGWSSVLVFFAGVSFALPVSAGELSTFSTVAPARDRRGVGESEIRNTLMDKIHSMNAAQQGIFSEDVTDIVAPYFPTGQPIRETEATLARQRLGRLRQFTGTSDPSKGSMYVASSSMMNGMGSTVYVVIDFDFDGTPGTMMVRNVKAYLRAKSM